MRFSKNTILKASSTGLLQANIDLYDALDYYFSKIECMQHVHAFFVAAFVLRTGRSPRGGANGGELSYYFVPATV